MSASGTVFLALSVGSADGAAPRRLAHQDRVRELPTTSLGSSSRPVPAENWLVCQTDPVRAITNLCDHDALWLSALTGDSPSDMKAVVLVVRTLDATRTHNPLKRLLHPWSH